MSSLFRRAGAKLARFVRRVGNPPAVPGSMVLYTKDVGGPTELFAVNEAGVVQLTPPLILPFTSWRKLGNGTGVAVAGGATVTLGTFTRSAGELVIPLAWVENNVAGAQWAWDRSALVSIADAMSFFFERTANANEFTLRVRNGTVATSRTVSWMVMGIVP